MTSRSTAAAANEPDVRALKAAMRRDARRSRAAIAKEPPSGAPSRAGTCLVRDVVPAGDVVVAGFWPIGSEIDCRPILDALHDLGYACSLPVVVEPCSPLVFRRWHPDLPLEAGAHGERIPPADAGEVVPDVLIVPGLAFDREGFRLGYGKGYYDRTLAALRAEKDVIAAGLAYAGQLVSEVPREDEDQRLDWIVTDDGTIACGAHARELRAL